MTAKTVRPFSRRYKLAYCDTARAFPIALYHQGAGDYAVVYGQECHEDLDYADACTQLGAAYMHALACEGLIRNDDDD